MDYIKKKYLILLGLKKQLKIIILPKDANMLIVGDSRDFLLTADYTAYFIHLRAYFFFVIHETVYDGFVSLTQIGS